MSRDDDPWGKFGSNEDASPKAALPLKRDEELTEIISVFEAVTIVKDCRNKFEVLIESD
jgi:hypothetical protein